MSRESERRAKREARRTADQQSAATERAGAARSTPSEFLGEVRGELRKVAWPSRREVISYTILVLIVTVILTTMVYGMDEVIRRAVFNTLGQ